MRVRVVWLLAAAAVASVASEAQERELLASSASSGSSASSHAGDAGGEGSAESLLPVTPPVSSSPPAAAPTPPPITLAPTPPPAGFLPEPPSTNVPTPEPPSTTEPAATSNPSTPAPTLPNGTPAPAPTTSQPGFGPRPPRPVPVPDPPTDPPTDAPTEPPESPNPPAPPDSPNPPAPPQLPPTPNPAATSIAASPRPAPTPAPESPSPPPGRPTPIPPPISPVSPPPSPTEETESPSPPPRQPRPPTPGNNRPTSPSTQPTPPSPATPAPPNTGSGGNGNGGTGGAGGGGASGENRESSTPSQPSQPDSPSSSSSPSSPSTPSDSAPTPTPTPKRYQRGDDVIIITKVENGTNVTVEVVVSPSQSPAVVVRDTNKVSGSQGVDSGATTATGSDDNESVFKFLQYLTSSLAFASLLLLIGFHFLAPRPTSPDSDSVAASLSTPNQWELLVFITYIQAMASSALYIVRAAPAYYWRYLDAFSWTMFLPFHSSESGISYSSTLDNQRRLSDVVVLDGLIAFADRIGVNEEDLLETSVASFLVVGGALLLLALVVLYVVRVHKDDEFDSETPVEQFAPDCSQVQSIELEFHEKKQETPFPLLVVNGIIVIFAAFAFYPLVLMTTFEIASQIRAGQVSGGSLTIAIFALFLVCAAFVARSLGAVVAARDTQDSYQKGLRYRTVWGSLCSSDCINYERRVIFVSVWLIMQVFSALIVSCVQSEQWQLALLIAVDVAFVVSLIAFRPFTYTAKVAIVVICSVALVKAVNTALAFGFLSTTSSSTSKRRALASTFIILNSVVIILWFVRLFGLGCRLARSAWDKRTLSRKNTTTSSAAARSSTPGSTRNQSTQYVAIVPTRVDGHSAA